MEEHIRKLEAELHNKPDDFQVGEVRRPTPTYKSFIKRSTHGEFLLTLQSVEIPPHEQASLEVLVAENGTSATLRPDQYTASHATGMYQGTHQQTPERLRIRYAPIVKTLEKVCRETLTNYQFWPNNRNIDRTGCVPTVLLRPFKLLVAYEKEIRDSVHNIDALWDPPRRKDLSGEEAEIRVVNNCEYDPPRLVIMTLYAPHRIMGFAPLPVLTAHLRHSRIQARRSTTGTKTSCKVPRRGPQANFRSA